MKYVSPGVLPRCDARLPVRPVAIERRIVAIGRLFFIQTPRLFEGLVVRARLGRLSRLAERTFVVPRALGL